MRLISFLATSSLFSLLAGASALAQAPASAAGQRNLQFVTLVDPAERPALFAMLEKSNNEICRRLQFSCTLRYFPAARAAAMVESGEADGENYRVPNFTADGMNPRHVRVDAPLFPVTFVAWGKPSTARVASWDDLANQDQAVIHLYGSKMVTRRLETRIGDKLLPTHSVESGLNMLAAGRGSYFVTSDSRAVEQKIFQLKLEKQVTRLGTIERVDTYMYLNDKHKALAPQFKRAIEDLKKDGTLEALLMDSGDMKASAK